MNYIKTLTSNSRFYFLFTAGIIALTIYIWVKSTIPIATGQAIKLDQLYALLAVFCLYFSILAEPLTNYYDDFPFSKLYLRLSPAIGTSALLFATLHTYFAFFGELGGFAGLGFLSGKYILAISLSATALLILFIVVGSTFNWLVNKLRLSRWPWLQRTVYAAIFLILVHALLLGSDFTDLSGVIPQIFFAALIVLLSLETNRLDSYLKSRWSNLPSFGLSFGFFLILAALATAFIYFPSSGGTTSPFNVHAAHIQLAKQAQQGSSGLNYSTLAASNPGLVGDRTRRFTVSFIHPDTILPNQDTNLQFQTFDASSGNQINLFQFVYTKTMHMIVVDSELNFFNHIHPTQSGSNFDITTQFPHPGQYHIYLDFQPLGAIEQQFAFTLNVGQFDKANTFSAKPDTNLTKTFGKYLVTLSFPSPLKAADLSIGNQTLTFTIKDSQTKKPITTLKPYLASFGHLVMINQTSFDYLHVHPTNIVAPQPNQNGGPTVDFLPLGLYGPIKPGIYRVFAQFNPDNNLFTSDFTLKVE